MAPGAASYAVEVGTSPGASNFTTVSSAANPLTITGMASNTRYYIRVIATNTVGSGASRTSAEVSQFTQVAPPQTLTSVGGRNQVQLTWTDPLNINKYNVYRSTTGVAGSYTLLVSAITSKNYTDSSATAGSTYYYLVRSDNSVESADSPTTSKAPIDSFSMTSAIGNTSTSIQVSWPTPVAGATSFEVIYGTTSGNYTSTPITGATSPTTISGLTTGQTYYIRVVAKNTVTGGTTVQSVNELSAAPNSPPVISAISNQTTETEAALVVPFTITDADHTLTCTGSVAGSSSNTAVISNANIVITGTAPNCTATITPTFPNTGSSTITLGVSDPFITVNRTFTVTVTPCIVNSIAWETQPVGMAAGNNFGTAPRVSLRRANNSLCTTNNAPVSIAISTDNSLQQDATITGTSSLTPSGGYAQFSAAGMTRAGVGFTIKATQGGVSSANSSAFTVTTGASTQLVYSQQPLSTSSYVTMSPNPQLRTADIYGNYTNVSGVSVTLTLRLAAGGGGTGLTGTLTRMTDATGTASFDDISIDNNTATTYFLRASATGYTTIDSNNFNVTALAFRNLTAINEMLHTTITHNSGNINYPRTAMQFGTDHINGTTNYTWQIVASWTGGCPTILGLPVCTANTGIELRRNGTLVSTINISASTNVTPTYYTATINNANLSANDLWSVTINGNTVKLYSSKIIVAQTGNAFKTQTTIPLFSVDDPSDGVATSSTSFTSGNGSYLNVFPFDKNKNDFIDSAYFIYTLSSSNAGSQACIQLYDNTAGAAIAGTTNCHSGTAEATYIQPVSNSALPTTGNLQVQIRSSGGASITIYKAALVLRLVGINDVQSMQLVSAGKAGVNATTQFNNRRSVSYGNQYVGRLSLIEKFYCGAISTVNGSMNLNLIQDGTNTNGTGGTVVTGSTLSYTNETPLTYKTSGGLTLTAGNAIYGRMTRSSGTYDISGCLHITEAAY